MHKVASLSEAKKFARRHPGVVVQWDGGEGWTCEGFWCPRRDRFVSRTFNPATGGFC